LILKKAGNQFEAVSGAGDHERNQSVLGHVISVPKFPGGEHDIDQPFALLLPTGVEQRDKPR